LADLSQMKREPLSGSPFPSISSHRFEMVSLQLQVNQEAAWLGILSLDPTP
jgi:hypothetical protein